MNFLVFKSLFVVLATFGTSFSALCLLRADLFTTNYTHYGQIKIIVDSDDVPQSISANKKVQETKKDNIDLTKIDLFVKSITGRTLESEYQDQEDLDCIFLRDLTIISQKFKCEVFSHSEITNFENEKNIEIDKFTSKMQKSSSIPTLHEYHKITVNKDVWDKWTDNYNKYVNLSIFLFSNFASDVTLLFGVQGNTIINTDQTTSKEFINDQGVKFSFSQKLFM